MEASLKPMTSHYLFEVSPDKPIEPGEPFEANRSFYLDLTPDLFEGITRMSLRLRSLNEDFAGEPSHMRIFQWYPNTNSWGPHKEPTVTEYYLGEVFTSPEDTLGIVFAKVWCDLNFPNRGQEIRKYVYLMPEDEEGSFEVYTSDTLETLQGMITAFGWFRPEQRWQEAIPYIFEDGTPMEGL